MIRISKRLEAMPPYIFAKLEQMKSEAMANGIDIIDLGVGDPDFPTPDNIVNALKSELNKPANFRYPSFKGEIELRKEVANWYLKNYSVNLDPETEILILIGAKEGIAHIPLALVNERETVLVPDPGYPAYYTSVLIAGGKPYLMPLKQENEYLPVFQDIPDTVIANSRLMFLNYPNNPTSALATSHFFEKTIKFARKNKIIVCHDFAYSEISFEEIKPISFLSLPGAKEIGIEFHSFSKTFAMCGCRIGFVAGNKKVISALAKLKSCIDSGVFKAIQNAGIEALRGQKSQLKLMISEYILRRNILVAGLRELGWEFNFPKATYYLWLKVPLKYGKKSMDFSEFLLKEKGVLVTPGIGFGQHGEGYVRLAINTSQDKIRLALERLKKL